MMRGNSLSRSLLLSSCALRRLFTSPSSSLSSSFPPLRRRFRIPNMDASKSSHSRTVSSQSSTEVEKFQQVFHSHSTGGGWQKCWKEGLTPWDLGQPTPILLHLHNTGALPKGRALVPGCGSGYDVVAIAGPQRFVVGIDISETAIEKALEAAVLNSSSSNGEYFEFLKADFFAWCPTELFDFIFDYTFFCALEPDVRTTWAVKMRDLLKPDGELMTLMFPISDHKGGPHTKSLLLIMKKCCAQWVSRQYLLMKMNWQLHLARERRNLRDGKDHCVSLCCDHHFTGQIKSFHC